MFKFMVADDPTIPLTVREYGTRSGDYQMVDGWLRERGEFFAETVLPPLGVVVEQNGDAVAAMWCYESFGIGVAFLEFPCTRPGISPGLAWRALAWAEQAIVSILRARGEHKLVRAFAKPRHAKAMKRLGYEATGTGFTSVMRRID